MSACFYCTFPDLEDDTGKVFVPVVVVEKFQEKFIQKYVAMRGYCKNCYLNADESVLVELPE
jgi:hypothetical protein